MSKDWNEVKSKIHLLYMVQGKPLREVIPLMKDKYHFKASKRAYKSQLGNWGFHKYKKSDQHGTIRRETPTAHHALLPPVQSHDRAFMLGNEGASLSTYLPLADGSPLGWSNLQTEWPLASPNGHDLHGGTEEQYNARLEPPISAVSSASAESFLSSPDPENNSFDQQDHEGKTQLHHAVLSESLKDVEHLLSMGATVDVQDNQRNHALHYAASKGFDGIIEILLKWNANVNATGPENKTPLHMALRYPKAFRALLKAHPVLSAPDERGDTALHLAISASQTIPLKGKVIEKLVSSGANVNVRNNAGITPFHMVVNRTRPVTTNCNRYLATFLASNADISLRTNDDELPFAVFLEKSNPYWMQGSYRFHDLHEVDASSIFKAFIRNGADPNTRLKSGELILHRALTVFPTSSRYDRSVLEMLCDTADVHKPAVNGDFPLHSSVRHLFDKNLFINPIEKLLHRGAIPSQMNSTGDSPIVVLLEANVAKSNEWLHSISTILETLLNGGADAMQRDSSGDLPIYLAARKYTGEMQKTLIKLLVDAYTKKNLGTNENLEDSSNERWWREYHELRQNGYWVDTTRHLISGEGMPADVADTLPKILLSIAATDILLDVKTSLMGLKERFGLCDEGTQDERDHYMLILRDCLSLKLDIEPSWYHFLLDLFD